MPECVWRYVDLELGLEPGKEFVKMVFSMLVCLALSQLPSHFGVWGSSSIKRGLSSSICDTFK